MKIRAKAGPNNSLCDVSGLKVGHARDTAVRTGVTVIIPDAPVIMAVDVRGGGPGTRDTDACSPENFVTDFHGLVLSGGSVFGLGAADRIALMLSEAGIGIQLKPRAVPVVPSAILYDLANGGDKNWGESPPYGDLAREAMTNLCIDPARGSVGAGTGATAGDRPGGVGMASLCLDDGLMVAALIIVNSFGLPRAEAGGPDLAPGEIDLPKLGLVGTNTTIGLIATNLTLDKAQAKRLAMMAQDGLAQTLRPIHTPFDGDTIFAMALRQMPMAEPAASTMAVAGTLAADCVAMAVKDALASAVK